MLLQQPVQRIPRYILLLDALVAHTPTTHTDYADLCQALDVMKRFTESANQTQRNYERYQAILRLHELLQPQIPVRLPKLSILCAVCAACAVYAVVLCCVVLCCVVLCVMSN
jgi:uncharacterized membrane protein